MDEVDVKKQLNAGKARRLFNVSGEHRYIHPEYEIVKDSEKIGSTGLSAIV